MKPQSNRVELGCVLGAFIVYLLLQLHALAFHGYCGQDCLTHQKWIMQAASEPWEFFTHYEQGRTNPPLYHLLAGALTRLVSPPRAMPAIGLMNVVFGLIGCCCTYGVIRRLIGSPVLRVATMLFILFLPFAMIQAEVVASDALATPLACILLWLIVPFPAGGSNKAFLVSVISIALLLLVGLYVKFTFGSLVAASAVWIVVLWRNKLITLRRLTIMLLAMVVVPGLVGYREASRFLAQEKEPWGIESPSLKLLREGQMNLRSMVWLRPDDGDVLRAPPYNRTVEGRHDLLVGNKHSLPALMHLGIFTDNLNIFQYDPDDQYFGRRTKRNHRLMEIAVRSGIVFSLLAVIGVAILAIASARSVLFQRSAREMPLFGLLLFCGAWFVNIVAMFPFIAGVYLGGYWTPRLIAPSLIGFFVVGFVLLDRLPMKKLHVAILALVVAQSAVHASFLWPRERDILKAPMVF